MDWRVQTQIVNDATYAAWNAHDPVAVAAVFALDARTRDVGSDDWEFGRSAVERRARALLSAFPDLGLARQALVVDGPHHADRWILTGTHTGALFGIEASGRPVQVEGMTFTTLGEDGLVVEDIHHADLATLFRQIGAA